MAAHPEERSWTCTVYAGTDGSAVFRGGVGHSLVIDPAGTLWRARSYEDFDTTYVETAATFEIATLTPRYTEMRQYRKDEPMAKLGRVAKRSIAPLIGVLAAIQFVPVDRSNPTVETVVPATPEVRAVLRRACYDCHSNESVWPAYSRIAPISWLVAHDVHEGRDKLNFSTWNRLDATAQAKALRESWSEVDEGEMPPKLYLPLHKEARLSAADRALLREWTASAVSSSPNVPATK
ncbi:MAG: heme-binding domain-containing protein [Acidobacteriota bacterium]